MAKDTGYSVVVIDNFNRYDPDSRIVIDGFENQDHALSYGLRRVRSSVEQFRDPDQGPDQTRDDLYRKWMALGEEVLVDGQRLGLGNFDRFAATRASREECDYLALAPEDPDP